MSRDLRIAVLALLVASTAAASPIERLWEVKMPCERANVVDWRDDLAWLEHGRVQRVARKTGKLAKPLVLSKVPDHAYIAAVNGDDLVVHLGHSFAVVDGTTGKQRWFAEQLDRDGGLPRPMVADGDVLFVHPASLGQGDPPVFVERLAIANGHQKWRAEMPPASGQINWAAVDAGRLYMVTQPDMIGQTVHLAAFDVATGKRLWAQVLTSKRAPGTAGSPMSFVAIDGLVLFIMPGEGLHVLQGATGKIDAKVAMSNVPDGAREIAVDATHVYVAAPDAIVAIDRAAVKIAWTIPRVAHSLHPTPVALYVNDGEELVAHDLADGHVLATWGVDQTSLVYRGASLPVLAICEDGKRLVAFDPSGTVIAPEHATITGTLTCSGCDHKQHEFRPFVVRIGYAAATSDKRGRFELQLDARGQRELYFELPLLEATMRWVGDTRKTIHFTGKKTYKLGTLRVVLRSQFID